MLPDRLPDCLYLTLGFALTYKYRHQDMVAIHYRRCSCSYSSQIQHVILHFLCKGLRLPRALQQDAAGRVECLIFFFLHRLIPIGLRRNYLGFMLVWSSGVLSLTKEQICVIAHRKYGICLTMGLYVSLSLVLKEYLLFLSFLPQCHLGMKCYRLCCVFFPKVF